MYTCALCGVVACGMKEKSQLPANCPMHKEELIRDTLQEYYKQELSEFYVKSSEIEAIGYNQWTRLKEILHLCRSMRYHKIGIAFCKGLHKEAKIAHQIIARNGFEVVSVICKVGGIDKEEAGISPECKKVRDFEPMCNPITQAKLLNEEKPDFYIALGLCVGHDSLFYKYSDAMVTTLVTKDRVLAHNPVGALYQHDAYYKKKLDLD
jgi:uncharacterized metal-binding protein